MLGAPPRRRDKAHLKYVATQACLVCGRQPSDPHHLRFAQPTALGRKVSDEFTVPLCRGHHRELHRTGNERKWWSMLELDPMAVAARLWNETHLLPQTNAIDFSEKMPPHDRKRKADDMKSPGIDQRSKSNVITSAHDVAKAD